MSKMIDERAGLKEIFSEMCHRLDGRACIITLPASFIFLAINILWPSSINTQYGDSDKWIALWSVMPVSSFLIYLRLRQLIDSTSMIADSLRLFLITGPTIVLVYFNFI